jgi:hypothetical protein
MRDRMLVINGVQEIIVGILFVDLILYYIGNETMLQGSLMVIITIVFI